MAVRSGVDLTASPWSPDPEEREEEERSTEQAGPHEDPEHDEDASDEQPQPRVPPPGPCRRPPVAQRRGEVRLRELAAAAEDLLGSRALAEDEEEADAERDGDDERQGDEDQVAKIHGPCLQGNV